MTPLSRWKIVLLAALVVVVGAAPMALYWYVVGRAPAVTAQAAKARLAEAGSQAVLVDVRPPADYAAGHIQSAVNWPYEQILALKSSGEIPETLRGKPLILLCQSGIMGAQAALKLQTLGAAGVANVRGGMEMWVASAAALCPLAYATMRVASGETTPLPFRTSPWYEQWVPVITGFGLKPAYMTLSLVLASLLRKRKSPDLAALKWAMLFFFIGEAFCAANYLAAHDESYLFEYLHGFGMVLCFGFATYAMLEGIDLRLIRYSPETEKCSALALCRACIKYADVPCGLRRVFLILIPATIILAFMPILAEPSTPSYNTEILGTLYNYSHPVIFQFYEIRFCPAVAIALLAASFLVLLLRKKDPVTPAKILFAAGMGPLGFSFLRLMLLAPYRDNLLWFVTWEEVTEFLFVAGAAAVLWIFRKGLFAEKAEAPGA